MDGRGSEHPGPEAEDRMSEAGRSTPATRRYHRYRLCRPNGVLCPESGRGDSQYPTTRPAPQELNVADLASRLLELVLAPFQELNYTGVSSPEESIHETTRHP
jgi:hypothetical protein